MPVKIKKLKSSIFPKLKFEKTSCKLKDNKKQLSLNLIRGRDWNKLLKIQKT